VRAARRSGRGRLPALSGGGVWAGKLRGSRQEQADGLKRTLNIAKAFETRGAVQGDPEKGMTVVMQNRSAKRMNDVG